MMNDDFKDDKLIRLSTLAEQTGISVHCIRTYVDQGMIQVNDRTAGGLLLFSEPAIERIQFIRTARDAGVPLAQIIRLLAASDNGDADGISISLAELNQTIQDARSKVSAFEQSLSHFRDNGLTKHP
jgi:MerR family transcriptional regulator, mercuric resistance operon regulatory protein